MLEIFAVENYKSFDELTVIDFTNKYQPNTMNIMYGANGSGKSNIVEGIHLLQQIVTQEEGTQTTDFTATPFAFNNENTITTLGLIMKLEDVSYSYILEINCASQSIENEVLSIVDEDGEEEILIERNEQYIQYLSKEEEEALFANDLNATSIFYHLDQMLSSAGKKSRIYKKIFAFIAGIQFGFEPADLQATLADLHENKRKMNKLNRIISGLDLAIDEVTISENNGNYEMQAMHGEVPFTLEMESKGIAKLLKFFAALAVGVEHTFILDDVETHLHEAVLHQVLVYLSLEDKNQFIVTTHALTLLNVKQLRDKTMHQLLEKDVDGSTEIERLDIYKDLRLDERHSWSKMYAEHRLIGYPNITLVEE